MFKIKLLNKISRQGLDRLPADRFICSDSVEDPDGIIVRSADMHNLDLPQNLLAIARAGAGTNNIPVANCSETGIVVFNTPGANANAVKELVLCSLFLSSRKIADGIVWAKTLAGGGADVPPAIEKGKSAFAGPEILGKTLGVVGLGAIGVLVANAAHRLEMQVLGFDPYISVTAAWNLSRNIQHAKDIKTILENSDYVSLHVPLNNETRGMFNAAAFSTMRQGAKLLNFSRADLVVEDDLLAALDSGQLSCYVTDFPTDRLLSHPKVIAIPHLGASTPESEENCAYMAAGELKEFLENGNIRNSVNLPDVIVDRVSKTRMCVIHRNIPNVLSNISKAFGEKNINIEEMVNKSKKDYAYTILEICGDVSDDALSQVIAIEGVIRVRVIK